MTTNKPKSTLTKVLQTLRLIFSRGSEPSFVIRCETGELQYLYPSMNSQCCLEIVFLMHSNNSTAIKFIETLSQFSLETKMIQRKPSKTKMNQKKRKTEREKEVQVVLQRAVMALANLLKLHTVVTLQCKITEC